MTKQPSLGFFPLLSSAFRSGDTEKNDLHKLLIFGIHPESRVVANTLGSSHLCGSGDHGWSALFPVVCKEREIELVNGTESKDPRNFFRKWFRPIDWQKRSTERPQAPGTTGTPVTFSLAKCSENICSANCLTHNERTLQSHPPAHNHFLRRPPNSSDHTPNPTLLSDHLQLLVPLQQQTEQVLPGENSNRSGPHRKGERIYRLQQAEITNPAVSPDTLLVVVVCCFSPRSFERNRCLRRRPPTAAERSRSSGW